MKNLKYIFILGSLFLAMNANAQTAWTLEECIKYAVEHNISIKQKEISQKAAQTDLNSAKMEFLPDLNAGVGQNWNFGRTQLVSGLYENQTQSNTSFSIGSSMPIFTGFRLINSVAKAKLDFEASTLNLQIAKDDIELQVTRIFVEVLFQKDILKIVQNKYQTTKQQVLKTEILTQNGKVPESQLFDIKSEMANDTLSMVQEQNNLKLLLLNLAQSLELQDFENFDILVPEMEVKNYVLQTPQDIYNKAQKDKSWVKLAETLVQSSEKSLKIAQSFYYPTISFSAGVGTNYFYLYNSNLPNSAFKNQFTNNLGEYIGLSLNIPIFNRLSVINGEKQAKFNIERQKLALEDTKKQLFKEIQTAYINAISASEKQSAATQAVISAQESFRYAKESYESGKSSVFEFTQSQTRLFDVQLKESQAKFDYLFKIKILEFYEK
ncbi:MAG: TolC family protein [Prevotellaceae bacterium]|nr:TolC family protein [Prevotellaceae bacterium]